MKLSLAIKKSLEENAADYFDAAKKARSKIVGAQRAIERAKLDLERAKGQAVVAVKQAPRKIRKKVWYEKFKWFWASNGFLIIAGRDATTNELLIKKHTDEHDIVFHTDAPGSPFVVIKTDGNEVPEAVLEEAAIFCASHSKAWKLGLSAGEVYWVLPEQVTKEAKAGEYMSKGSFMVYGKRNYLQPVLGLVAVPFEDKVMICPQASAKPYFKGETLLLKPGPEKNSDVAKKIASVLEHKDLDDILPGLPAGGAKTKKVMITD